jgi:RNA polymerase sigma-B factor
VSSHAQLDKLPDNALLARMHALPRGSAEREAVCEILVERYAGMVRSCVWRYRRSPEPAEDLLQVGYVGLLKAINNFDPSAGESLGAYAQPCISGEIKRHFRDRRWQLRVTRQAQELLLEMRPAEEALTQQLGRTPDDGELAAHLGVPVEDVREARRAHLAFATSSLDAPLSHREDPALLGDIMGEDDPAISHAIDIEAVHVHLVDLPEREQRILMLRFYGNLTQSQIGARLGISQMHVSRLLERALAYLRDRMTDTAETALPARRPGPGPCPGGAGPHLTRAWPGAPPGGTPATGRKARSRTPAARRVARPPR